MKYSQIILPAVLLPREYYGDNVKKIPPDLGNSVRIINIKNNLNPLVCQPSDHSLQLPSRPGLLLSQGRFNDADTEIHVHIVISRVFTFSLLYEDIRHCKNKKKEKTFTISQKHNY